MSDHQANSRDSGRPRHEEEAAALAFESGDFVRAEQLLLQLRQSSPVPPSLHHNLGMVQAALGKHREAVESFTLAMLTDPRSVANRGYSFDALGEIDKAEVDYLSALGMDPNDIDSMVNLGLIYVAREDWSAADDLLGRAAALDPSAAWPYADVLIQRGALGEARRILVDVVMRGEARANLDLALIDIQEGHIDDGEARLLLAIEAGAARGRVEYATLLLNRGRTDEALRVAQIGVDEGDDWSYAPLAVALCRLGRFEEASEHLRSALRLGDQDFLRSMLLPSNGGK